MDRPQTQTQGGVQGGWTMDYGLAPSDRSHSFSFNLCPSHKPAGKPRKKQRETMENVKCY